MNTDQRKEQLITLKEAAKISGYAPDYIGQLIRKGKLEGKQVYCTVAWMTTEEAIRHYIEKDKKREKGFPWREMKLARLFKTVLYLVIFLSVGFSLLLFSIFSVGIDQKLQENAKKRLQAPILNSSSSEKQ